MKKMLFRIKVDDYVKTEIIEIEDEYDNQGDICNILEDWMRTNVKYGCSVLYDSKMKD